MDHSHRQVEPQKKITDVLVAADGAFGEALQKEVAVLESLMKVQPVTPFSCKFQYKKFNINCKEYKM